MRRRTIGFVVAQWCGVALCAPSVNLEDPLSLGSCTCDLTQAQCDVNCCCDPDCEGLASGFSCLPEGPQSASQYCYSKSWLHSVNPRVDLWVISDDLRGLLCVSVDNSAVQGEVFQNEAILSSSQIDAIIQEQSLPTSTVATGDVAVRGYQTGDILKVNSALSGTVELILGASTLETATLEVVRPLSIAAAGPSGTCATGNGQVVRFLNEVPSTSCWKQVDLATQCTTTLNPRQLLDTWMLHRQYLPEDMRCGERCLIPTTCLVQRKAVDGSVVSLEGCDGNASVAASSFATGSDGSCTCTGAVENLHFQFHFGLVSDVVSITKVNVSYSIQDIYSAGCQSLRVQQGGSVHFLQDQSGSQLVEARSGNPGYITGLPLLVADCTLVDGSCNYGGRRDATVPGILPGGKCALLNASTADTQEVKINFGENAIFGCILDLTRAELKSLCGGTALANGFVGYLKMLPFGSTGSSWTQIAAFGSVPNDAQDSADFVQVEESPRTETLAFTDSDAAQKASTSTCTGAVVGVELEVIYSSFGKIGNPQMKVVGSRISHQQGALSYTLADATKKQSFQFTYTVKFTHTGSERMDVKVPPRPQLPLSLPPDLFYPFTLGSASVPAIHFVLIAALWVVIARV